MNVYWGIYLNNNFSYNSFSEFSELEYYEPENVYKKNIYEEKQNLKNISKHENYLNCPSVNTLLNNTYSIKFPFNYRLDYIDGNIKSDMYDQKFFNEFVLIRDIKNKIISINVHYLFFSEESLEIMLTSSYFSNNDFNKFNRIIPGKFDISSWIRPIEIPIITDSNCDNIFFKKGDDALYLTFLTNEKIKLKKFLVTEKIHYIINTNMNLKNYKTGFSKLDYFYKKFIMSKQKNLILREIKNNLME